MEFLIGVGAMTLFMIGLAIWAVRADKKDKEREQQHAQAHEANN